MTSYAQGGMWGLTMLATAGSPDRIVRTPSPSCRKAKALS